MEEYGDETFSEYKESSPELPYNLKWVFGHQTKVLPINISSQSRKSVFFAAGSFGVCFNWNKNTQNMLFGHMTDIISATATNNKTYLATADSGTKNSVIVWNLKSHNKVFIISEYFAEEGVTFMTFSSDESILLTLSGQKPQELNLWDWKSQKSSPILSHQFKNNVFQHHATFHSKFSNHFSSTGEKTVFFFEKNGSSFSSSVIGLENLYKEKICKKAGLFTQTAFSITSSLAYTVTTKGMAVIWGLPLYKNRLAQQLLSVCPEQRVCLRMLQLESTRCALYFLTVKDDYLVVGTEDSRVRFYNEALKLIWSIDVKNGPVNNVSFNFKPRLSFKNAVKKVLGKVIKESSSEKKIDFIVSTTDGFAAYVNCETLQVQQILFGTCQTVKAVTVHPFQPYIYLGENNGTFRKWNYETKTMLSKAKYADISSDVECLSIDCNSNYIASAFSNGSIAVFDCLSFSAQPCFVYDKIRYCASIKFSPDSQYLMVVDDGCFVSRFQLHLLVPSALEQAKYQDSVSLVEPLWCFRGKTRQHRGHIMDFMFNYDKENESILFYTLGNDYLMVEYNLLGSKSMEIDVTKTFHLDKTSVPICMCWYPLYGIKELFAVATLDNKLRIYNLEEENMVRIVSLPSFSKPYEKILVMENFNFDDGLQCFIFNISSLIGLAKFPVETNPNSCSAVLTHIKGINTTVWNSDQTFLFTAGTEDSWICMYEINAATLMKSKNLEDDEIDAFKSLFPSSEDPDEMKRRLIFGVYSLELETKLLNLCAEENPILKGEIPINYLEYIMAVLGFYVSPRELQLMINDIQFENIYSFNGLKKTVRCLDIIRLYVSYRPDKSITKESIAQSFKAALSFEEDQDYVTRARFVEMLASRGDQLPPEELLSILKCLKSNDNNTSSSNLSSVSESHQKLILSSENVTNNQELDLKSEIKRLVPEIITEKVFLRDILCLEKAEEDLSEYVLNKEDYKLKQKELKVEDFALAVQENFFT